MSDHEREENGGAGEAPPQAASERSRSRSRSRDKESSRDKDKKKDKDKKSKRRSRSKSRDRDRRSSRRGSKDKDRDRRRRRSSSPKKRASRDRSRSRDKQEDDIDNSAKSMRKHYKDDTPDEPEKDMAEYTVFVCQIHPKVDERDLFEFFSHVGRVEDIRLIRDQRTQRSKGLCYVEFSEKDSVIKAVALTGQLIGGYPITIQIIESEASKMPPVPETKPMKLYVGNLHVNVSEGDLKPVFEAFGPLDFIDLHKDPATGASRGFGFVQYKSEADGNAALGALNGLDVAGQQIKVGVADTSSEQIGNLGELEEENGGVAMTAQSRSQLMARLQRDGAPPQGMGGAPPPMMQQQPQLGVPRIQPTTCVVIKNMFNPAEETDTDFHLDIQEDLMEECGKFGPVKHIVVDKDDTSGRAYLHMADVKSAQKLVAAFDGRWFASRKLGVEFVVEHVYFAKFPEANK